MESVLSISGEFFDVARMKPVDLGILHITSEVDRVVLQDPSRRRWVIFDIDRGMTVHPSIASLDTAPEWKP